MPFYEHNAFVLLTVYFRCDYLAATVETTFRTNMVRHNKVATVAAFNKLWSFEMHVYTASSACASF